MMSARWHMLYLGAILVIIGVFGYVVMGVTRTCDPMYRVGKPLTKGEIRAAMGEPGKVIEHGQPFNTSGEYPKPPSPEKHEEVWIYYKLMFRTFVYFDDTGRARMIFYSTT